LANAGPNLPDQRSYTTEARINQWLSATYRAHRKFHQLVVIYILHRGESRLGLGMVIVARVKVQAESNLRLGFAIRC